MTHEHYFASSDILSNILERCEYLHEKHKRMVTTSIDLMSGTKSSLTSTTPSAGVGLKIALFMELGRDYPFGFLFFSSLLGDVGRRRRSK
jgi:hypothetical protein